MSSKEDFVESYRKIYTKLKKKSILRKPNYAECSEEINDLVNSLKRQSKSQPYIGFCLKAVARCEEALKNLTLEAVAFSDAGFSFWQREMERSEYGYLSFGEDFSEAVDCYHLAISVYKRLNKPAISAALYFEMAGFCKELGKNEEARDYFHTAAELQQENSGLCAINSLEKSVECNILLRDYGNTCSDLIWMMKLASEISTDTPTNTLVVSESGSLIVTPVRTSGIFQEIITKNARSVYTMVMMEAKVSLILVLILQGDFQQSRDFVSKLERDATANGVTTNTFRLIIELFETLIEQVERQDVEMVMAVQRELHPWMTRQQNTLVLMIIEELNASLRLASVANK
ncbi:hypothetical protein PROFUN_13544 [Planoprotostelium fungivorum]|uniref:Factor VIII intron 22 protein n=1 Tax=Planoprotostelium fungivorum TaxID=1890364 RepID=A0A2P6N3R1_9EUKA|nr:hypothetical protein PROFUN_13544 [Planoprotostelium fungivorum]